jgi:hypothetical protein
VIRTATGILANHNGIDRIMWMMRPGMLGAVSRGMPCFNPAGNPICSRTFVAVIRHDAARYSVNGSWTQAIEDSEQASSTA